ncbi:MAG: winged helix-turn-helix transcriptional regulator [Clostridiaceae bacterium]|nr:winged helix-turn-helix transcriptional regulator [Clostridiaceae bacterium]MBW4859193.1 winged helix-turn-helix transcriptional regulator [Clostridiaceae bacterium]MBW4868689.1 winged helix-turn-helix transcriptional regulator [Clostridiaceae bacterium]
MTKREKEILELISKNPMISQKEVADILGISRSSVAVHITNLMKKGYILGKGYIVKTKPYATVIGGANVDIIGFPYNKIIRKDSNPGKTSISLGGVGRNIGENLARLGIDTRLITVLGRDDYGKLIMEEGLKVGLNMSDSLVISDEQTSTYLGILDERGDMALALSSMDIFEKMTISFIEEKRGLIENSILCIVDTNINIKTLEYMVTNFKVDFFLDTVSTSKAKKVKDIVGYFHTIKPNKLEAEILSGIEINNEEDLKRASYYFIDKGVKRVFISLGGKGIYYFDGKVERHFASPKVKVINATGAGDAFLAGLAYSYFNDFSRDKTLAFATGASIITLENENTINPNISPEKIEKKIEEMGIC